MSSTPRLVGEFSSPSPRCLNSGDIDLLHLNHRLKGALCLCAASPKSIGQRARRDLPRKAPAVLAPTALAFRSAISNDRIPIAVRFFLIVRRDLKRKGLAVLEHRAAVEAKTRNAHHRELHRQHIALLAIRIVTGSFVNRGYFAIRKGGGVEPRRLMRVFVKPEADRILRLHVRALLVFPLLLYSMCLSPNQDRLEFALYEAFYTTALDCLSGASIEGMLHSRLGNAGKHRLVSRYLSVLSI